MPEPIAKFYNRETKPPRGGWKIVVDGVELLGWSEGELLEALARHRKRLGTFVSMLDCEREMWVHFCRREAKRCGLTVDSQQPGPAVPREIDKAFFGPIIWRMLNLAAATWTPEAHRYFVDFCEYLLFTITCPECRTEWREILDSKPPTGLNTKQAICHWVNDRHNEINRRTGKAIFSYDQMVREYGAPPIP